MELIDTVRLWTIQPLYVWERLREEKTLFVDPEHVGFERDFRDAYDWMRVQIGRRLTGYEGHSPWWAYEHKPGRRGFGLERKVRLELALPPERVLLSAYGAWHCVLTPSFLPHAPDDDKEYERESEAWENELKAHGLNPFECRALPEPWHSRMTASWERIFDVDALRDTNTIQACFERLRLEDVVTVTPMRFTGPR